MFSVFTAAAVASASDVESPRAKICFASCAMSDVSKRQAWWKLIADKEPSVFAWLGDAVYVDKIRWSRFGFPSNQSLIEPDFNTAYRGQKENPDYQQFISKTPIVGTWDDHDYGENDAGKRFLHKDASQRAFLDFLDVPQDSPRRRQKGVYASHRIPYGSSHVLLLLLDVRYHRDAWSSPDGDILGEEQWQWLEKEVANSDAKTIIIGSGIQVLWNDYGILCEHWTRIPSAYNRLLSLLSGRHTIFLSGDIHMLEVRHLAPWNALEVTSSGLTHSWGDNGMIRLSKLTGIPFISNLAHFGMIIAQLTLRHEYRLVNSLEKNFACIDISPDGAHVQAWSTTGKLLFQRLFAHEEFKLTFDASYPTNQTVGFRAWWLYGLLLVLLVTISLMVLVSFIVSLIWTWQWWSRLAKSKSD